MASRSQPHQAKKPDAKQTKRKHTQEGMFSVILVSFCVISYMMEEDHGNDSICLLITVNACCSSSSPSSFCPLSVSFGLLLEKRRNRRQKTWTYDYWRTLRLQMNWLVVLMENVMIKTFSSLSASSSPAYSIRSALSRVCRAVAFCFRT